MNKFLSIDPFNIIPTLASFKEDFGFIEDKFLIDSLISATKKTIFLRILHDRAMTDNRYLLSITYDLLCCISTIKKNEERYFYFNIRSCIENCIRFFLGKHNEDETGVTKLFNEFKDKFKNMDAVSVLSRIYSQSCNYVHNNAKANIDISRSYRFIDNSKAPNIDGMRKLVRELTEFHVSLNELLIFNNHNDIRTAYLYINENIKFLINEKFLNKIHE